MALNITGEKGNGKYNIDKGLFFRIKLYSIYDDLLSKAKRMARNFVVPPPYSDNFQFAQKRVVIA